MARVKTTIRGGKFYNSKLSFFVEKASRMKKAKIMLITIAGFATIGSALAFKMVKKYGSNYCYLQTNVNPGAGQGVCPNLIKSATANLGNVVNYYYTTRTAIDCAHQADCINPAQNFN